MRPTDQELEQRLINLRGEITDEVANAITAQLLFHESEDAKSPIKVLIESEGGSVTAALAIYDTIKYVSCPVHTRTNTSASGMAALLLAAGTLGTRVMSPRAGSPWWSPLPARASRRPFSCGR